jgi:hypothetical protein
MLENVRELERLKNKAKVWQSLHPEICGVCVLCPHLGNSEWCRTHFRLVMDNDANKAKMAVGILFKMGSNSTFGYTCIEWVRYV